MVAPDYHQGTVKPQKETFRVMQASLQFSEGA